MSSHAVGVDIGGTNLKAALVGRDEGILQQTTCPTEAEQGPEHVVSQITGLVAALSDAAPPDAVASAPS